MQTYIVSHLIWENDGVSELFIIETVKEKIGISEMSYAWVLIFFISLGKKRTFLCIFIQTQISHCNVQQKKQKVCIYAPKHYIIYALMLVWICVCYILYDSWMN